MLLDENLQTYSVCYVSSANWRTANCRGCVFVVVFSRVFEKHIIGTHDETDIQQYVVPRTIIIRNIHEQLINRPERMVNKLFLIIDKQAQWGRIIMKPDFFTRKTHKKQVN